MQLTRYWSPAPRPSNAPVRVGLADSAGRDPVEDSTARRVEADRPSPFVVACAGPPLLPPVTVSLAVRSAFIRVPVAVPSWASVVTRTV
jgi:hypothetical protein